MSKNSDRTNLQFFSNIATKQLENELNAIIQSFKSGKLSLKNALQLMEHATTDVHLIFWHITREIGIVKRILVNDNHNTEVLKEKELRSKLDKVSKEYFAENPGDDLA